MQASLFPPDGSLDTEAILERAILKAKHDG